ncbi:MAG: exonuclease domain-containing protein, partial [Bosea sp. (in: a-proteobacteria)]
DVGFLDMEFGLIGKPRLASERVLDTLAMARRKHPGASNSLDALCSRYGIDTSKRVKHGALLDAEILSDVYIELLGGKQADFGLSAPTSRSPSTADTSVRQTADMREGRAKPLASRLSPEEQAAHRTFVATLAGTTIWADYDQTSKSSG